MSAPLSCRDLSAGYRGRAVLRGVGLDVRPGEICALIGPNGSGKSTLLRCLCGEIRPFSGSVLLDGAPLNGLPPKARARRIAVLPQRPALPSGGVNAADLVLLGRYAHLPWHGLVTARDRAIARDALEAVDALALAGRDVATLSGGELQRVFLARALAQEADILLLDEPAGAMDPAHLADLFRLLTRRAAGGAAVLAVLHDVNAAALFCGRVLGLREGRIVFDERPANLTTHNLSGLYDIAFHAFAHPLAAVPQFCLRDPADSGDSGAAGAR